MRNHRLRGDEVVLRAAVDGEDVISRVDPGSGDLAGHPGFRRSGAGCAVPVGRGSGVRLGVVGEGFRPEGIDLEPWSVVRVLRDRLLQRAQETERDRERGYDRTPI